MADKYDDLQPDSNMRRLPGWGRGTPTPAPLVPKWAGQFDTHDAWVACATARLTGAAGSVGQDVPAICVDAKGRRCNVGRDFARARDEGAFPVRYFWECEPLPALAQAVVTGWQAAHECMLAVEYAANLDDSDDARGQFIRRFVARDLPDLLAKYPEYAAWRSERLKGTDHAPTHP